MPHDYYEKKKREENERDPAKIQTLIFDKDVFRTKAEALAWARGHGFELHKALDETGDSFRMRQRDPGDFEAGSFRTITLRPGVKAVIGRRK
jgi:hypothetical protein